MKQAKQAYKTQHFKRATLVTNQAPPQPNSNIHIFSKKMKQFAALAGHQHFRRALKPTDHCISPTNQTEQFNSNKFIIHRQERSLPKDPNNSGSYDNGSKISNTSDTLLLNKNYGKKGDKTDSNSNLREFHKRNFSPDIRINLFKPLHFRIHSEKPSDYKGSKKIEAEFNDEESDEIAKELGLNVRGDSCPYESKGSIDEYMIGKEIGIACYLIGNGAYAVVRVALHKESQIKTALKFYDIKNLRTLQRKKSLKSEIKILSKLNHNNIMKLYEAFSTSTHIVLALEYVNGMSLHALLRTRADRRLDEVEGKQIFKQLINALRYCHSKSVTHRYLNYVGISN